MDIEAMKKEAVKRMKQLEMNDALIQRFLENDEVYCSERNSRVCIGYPIVYNIEKDKALSDKVTQFEEKADAVVYHVQLSHADFGEMYSFLFVSPDKTKWAREFVELVLKQQVLVYTWNRFEGKIIERFSYIGIRGWTGAVLRTW